MNTLTSNEYLIDFLTFSPTLTTAIVIWFFLFFVTHKILRLENGFHELRMEFMWSIKVLSYYILWGSISFRFNILFKSLSIYYVLICGAACGQCGVILIQHVSPFSFYDMVHGCVYIIINWWNVFKGYLGRLLEWY